MPVSLQLHFFQGYIGESTVKAVICDEAKYTPSLSLSSFCFCFVLFCFSGTVPEQEEEFIPDEGLTKIDIIAIVIGLGLTTFLVLSIAVLLYRAQKRLNEAKYMNRWKISVKGQVSIF